MTHLHPVLPGETISSIAKDEGFANYLTIWNDPGNNGLRTIRHDPHILEVGDPVFIPDLPENVNHGNDTQRHVFALESPALLLNIQLQDLDGKPIAKQAVVLKVDAKDKNGREAVEDVFELDTDKNGTFSQEILEDADIGELTVGDDKFVIFIGLLGPIGSNEGMRARLNNLGYFAGLANDTDTEQLRWALEEFQHDNKISPPNGDVDDPRNKVKLRATQTKLGVIHGDRDVPT
jgi:Putative peptidoglycan binding domain